MENLNNGVDNIHLLRVWLLVFHNASHTRGSLSQGPEAENTNIGGTGPF